MVAGATYRYRIQALGPPPHLSDICGEAEVTVIPVFPSVLAGALALGAGLAGYAAVRRR